MTKHHLIAAAFAGCLAWAGLGSPSVASAQFYVEVHTAPSHIEEYPSTYYEGRPVYWYDGHWYYRRGPGWAYYRDEPRPLVVYRDSPEWHHHPRHYDRPRHYDHHDHRPPPPPAHHHHDDRRDDHHDHHHR